MCRSHWHPAAGLQAHVLPAAAAAVAIVAVGAHAGAQQSLVCTHLKGLIRTDTLMFSFAPLSGAFVEFTLSKVGVWGRLAVLRADMASAAFVCFNACYGIILSTQIILRRWKRLRGTQAKLRSAGCTEGSVSCCRVYECIKHALILCLVCSRLGKHHESPCVTRALSHDYQLSSPAARNVITSPRGTIEPRLSFSGLLNLVSFGNGGAVAADLNTCLPPRYSCTLWPPRKSFHLRFGSVKQPYWFLLTAACLHVSFLLLLTTPAHCPVHCTCNSAAMARKSVWLWKSWACHMTPT